MVTVPDRPAVWHHIFAGLCASLVSIGLARFAYTPLIPPLIEAHWFTSSDVVYLGAANLAGYFAGALLGRPLGGFLSNVATLRMMMLLVTAAFLACAFPFSVAWYFGWRFLSGVAGGAIMVLVTATVLPHVPAARKGLASGVIFAGVGMGIAGSGTIVPLLMGVGLRETWLGLGVVSAVLTAASWFAWPSVVPASQPPAAVHGNDAGSAGHAAPVTPLYVVYGLMAAGLVPGMVFIVDYIARGLGAGAQVGSMYWILYGAGAIIGPPLYGFLADRMGGPSATRLLLVVQMAALAALGATGSRAWLVVLTVIAGTFPPGVVPLFLARVREAVPHDLVRQNVIWSRLTMVFAAGQVVAGYGSSAIFNISHGDYALLFLLGGVAILAALIVDIGASLLPGRRTLAGPGERGRPSPGAHERPRADAQVESESGA